ncbi:MULTISPECIES: type II toxin-antitoxin system PemK/MazF family toxin [Rufibacter]|uniref:mRNA interferase MazF n=1 Tax=Rufibacter quisquiliarum TaxID=1549639 RepID=A0A839GFP2_9BACT|nr:MULTISPECIES: type II toxin-antitoxin system PemK/MazF family toxin [Rufibacter]MBA9077712.1 mRNA interferase MazF [Rufibacter quisquiliarum]
MTKGKIILVPFPFDDFSGAKVRPAVCLTNEIGFYNHVVIAFISSQLPPSLEPTDVLIEKKSKDFKPTGLSVDSVIKLHKIVTIPKNLIKRQLGFLSTMQQTEIDKKLKILFDL